MKLVSWVQCLEPAVEIRGARWRPQLPEHSSAAAGDGRCVLLLLLLVVVQPGATGGANSGARFGRSQVERARALVADFDRKQLAA